MRKKTAGRTIFERNGTIFMVIVGGISLLAISGWLFNLPILASLRPDYIPMAPATALVFLGLCGVWIIHKYAISLRGMRMLAQVVLTGLMVFVIILAVRYFTGLGPDLERILYPNPPIFAQFSSARISPLTAVGFILAIPAFLLLAGGKRDFRREKAAAGFAVALFTFCTIILLGYLFGAPLFYGGETIPMAITSALSFFFFSLGLLMEAGPECWPVSMYAGPSLKARLMRTFIPSSLLIVLLQGLLNTAANPWVINPAIRVAFAALISTLIVLFLVSIIANTLSADFERARQGQKQSEFLFRALFESSPDSVMLIDPMDAKISWPIVDCNETACRMNGYSRDELIGHSIDIVNLTAGTPEERNAYLHELRKVGILQMETSHRHKNGTIFPIEVSTTLIRVGERELVIGIDRDITERKRAEETLTKTEQIYRQAITRAGGVPYQLDYGSECYIFLGEGFENLTGYQPSEITGPLFTSRLRQVDSFGEYKDLSHEEYIHRARQGGVDEWRADYLFERKDGTQVWLADHSVQILDSTDAVTGALGILIDITERKQADQMLSQSEAELRALFASMHDAVLVIDSEGVYRKIAPTNPDLLVKAPEELFGKNLRDFFPPKQAETYIGVVRQVLETKQTAQVEYDLIIGDRTVQFETSISPMTDDRTLWVAHDITNRKRFELVQDAIFRITQAAMTADGVETLYHSIHSILGELIPAQNFYIALYDPKIEMISFPYYIDQYDDPPPKPTQLLGLTGYVIRTGNPLLATREVFDRLVEQGEVEQVGTPGVDWMGAPLKAEERMIGVMAVQSYTEGIHFNQEDLNLLEFVSAQVAQAIERKRMEEEIRNLSLTDELTGLYNRRGFTLLAEQEMKLAHRFKRGLLMFFADVDNLKSINDTYGHAQGDLALKEMAVVLRETFRETDIPARFGGDEFAVLAVDVSMESADILTNRIQEALEKRNKANDRLYQLGLSIGIVYYDPKDRNTLNELIALADDRMYTQKQASKEKK